MSELKVVKAKLDSVSSESDAALSESGKLKTSDGLAHVGNGMKGAQSVGTAGKAAESIDRTAEDLRNKLKSFVDAVTKTEHAVIQADHVEYVRFEKFQIAGEGKN